MVKCESESNTNDENSSFDTLAQETASFGPASHLSGKFARRSVNAGDAGTIHDGAQQKSDIR
jgi:hypothetical protein